MRSRRPRAWAREPTHRPVCCPQGARAHGCAWHTGGGRRLRRAERGRAGTAVLAGWGLRAGAQGLPLRAAVLRRWVRLEGRWCRRGRPTPRTRGRPRGPGAVPDPGAAPPPGSVLKHLGRKEGWSPLCPRVPSGEGGGERGGPAGRAAGSGHRAVGSLPAGGVGWEGTGRGCSLRVALRSRRQLPSLQASYPGSGPTSHRFLP